MPSGSSLYVRLILLETGVLGLFTTLLLQNRLAIVFGLTIVAGLAVFIGTWSGCEAGWYPDRVGAPSSTSGLLHALGAAHR